MSSQTQPTRQALLFLLVLIAAPVISFWPGTSGDFLVDDFTNLKPMQNYGGVTNLETLKAFVFSGISGPTGRPLSLATFLIDAQTWPANPYSFKRTNILLHALNGVVLFAVLFKLFQVMGRQNASALTIAFLASAIWLVHPFNTSTVLYVVQRMTELSALFTLLGIWCYLHGRQKLFKAPGPAYLWMSGGIVVFGLLATLSKENGILLPLYIAVIEFTLLRSLPRPKYWFHWSIPMIAGPIALLLGYMALQTLNHTANFSARDFTLYERLLTEPRVLLSYLGNIALPINTPTLNADDFIISKALLTPINTLPSILIVNALIILGIVYRKRFPLLAFAVLWFMAGHLLESTVMSLEIYFQHRNYLPMIGPVLALAWYLEQRLSCKRKQVIISTYALSGLLISALAITTWNYSQTWGDQSRLIATWAKEQPRSVRAQVLYSLQAIRDVNYGESLKVYNKVKKNLPDALGMDILYTDIVCVNNQLTPAWFNTLLHRAANANIDQYVQQSLNQLAGSVISQRCQQLSLKGLQTLVDALLANKVTPPLERRDAALQMLKAEIYLKQNLPLKALRAIDEVFRIKPSINLALKQAYLLAQGKQYDAALIQLNKAEAMDRLRKKLMPSHMKEINTLRQQINDKKPL